MENLPRCAPAGDYCPSSSDTPWRLLAQGARDTLPMIIGAIPFGLLFGALAVGAGLSVWQALGMSLLVFAGAAQFIAVGLLGAGAGVAVIVLTTLIVNARHALYSASLQPVIKHLALPWRMGLAFGLTDECYAVMLRRLEQGELGEHGHWYFAGTVLAMFSSWQLCSLLGALFGQALPNVSQWGLEFALVASFIGILLPMLKRKPQWLAALVAGGVAVLTRHWPYNTGLLLATAAGIACGVLFEMRSTAKEPS